MPASVLPVLPPGLDAVEVLSRHDNRLVVRCLRQTDPPQHTVVKCLLPPFDEGDPEGFRDEFLLLDALIHPNWVRPERFGLLPLEGYFLELEECPGVPLARWPLRGWWPENLEIARQLLSGLESLHRLGFAQVDLSPWQVMVTPERGESQGWGAAPSEMSIRARLLDLGFAARVGQPVSPRGTPGYVAPEILRTHERWDARVDLYALGAMLFDLFTGHRAFPGEDVSTILRAQLSGTTPDPAASVQLPPPVVSLLRELLHTDPNQRPISALEIWQRLREQAPRDRIGSLPASLTPGSAFAFAGRDQEIAEFQRWLERWEKESTGPELQCVLTGEDAVGRSRLADRLVAVAQSRGWARLGPPAPRRLRWPDHPGLLEITDSKDRDEPPLRTTTSIRALDEGKRLELALGPLAADTLATILRGQGVETPALAQMIASESLGSPGRCDSLWRAAPRELDLASRYLQGSGSNELLRGVDPPPDWVLQARLLLASLPAAVSRALLLMSILEEGGTSDDLRRWLGEAPALPALTALHERGYLTSGDGRWAVRSRLWAHALTLADPTAFGELARAILRRESPNLPELDVVRSFRLALMLEDTPLASSVLAPALRMLEEAGRLEEALEVWSEAVRGGLPTATLYADAVAIPLILAAFPLAASGGSILPAPEEMPASPDAGDAERLMRAWSTLARNRHREAEDLLSAPVANPAGEFVRLWFRARSWRFRGNMQMAGDDLKILEALSQPECIEYGIWVVTERSAWLASAGKLEQARATLEQACLESAALPAPLRAVFLGNLGSMRFQSGLQASARECLIMASELSASSDLNVTRGNADNTLAASDVQEGHLVHGQVTIEGLVRRMVSQRRATVASLACANLAMVAAERGRLGEAIRAASDARLLAEQSPQEITRTRAAIRQVATFARCGFIDRTEEAVTRWSQSLTDLPAQQRRQVLNASVELATARSEFEEVRRVCRHVVSEAITQGAAEDARERLFLWALIECAAGESARAAELFDESEAIDVPISGLTASLRDLVAGEILFGRDPASAETGHVLRRATETLDAQDRRYYSWRAHWRLGQSLAASGRPHESAREYAIARTVLTGIVESFGDVAPSGPFVALPIVQTFLRDLQAA